MGKMRFHSIFMKMAAFYVCFGVIPLVMISMIFFSWYYSDVQESTMNNYTHITEYVERNLSAAIEKADDTAGYMYDFTVDGYEHLYEILSDEKLDSPGEKIYINKMLQDMMLGSETISSLRFYTGEGEVYALFREQGKSLQKEGGILNEVEVTPKNIHDMILMPAVSEKEFYTNTKDTVFSIVRNYLDTTSVKSTEEKCLGTLYLDIKVDEIHKLVETVEVGEQGNIYVLDPMKNQWLFSTNKSAYGDGAVAEKLKGAKDSRILQQGKYWYFCEPVQNTDYYVVTQIFSENVLDTYIKNRTFIIVVLGFAILILVGAYGSFSGKMNGPVRKLKKAMQQVQQGNLNVRVEVHTNDEMEYLCEGFNKMVNDLAYYIEEVYVAKISQKDAELNALKMQIQPHYLYNILDVIRMTAMENKDEKTARLLESLARQLRYVIGQQRERVPLYMELNNIREYIVLMNARYQDKFRINVNVSDQDRSLYVLKLLLQPVVENCIKHGLGEKEGVGTIEVNAKSFSDYLEIIVMDDGVGMSKEEEQYLKNSMETEEEIRKEGEDRISIGLKNVCERIKLSCGEAYGFTITSVPRMGTMVKFRLPLWEEEDYVENGNC